jgi:hypothetical protein
MSLHWTLFTDIVLGGTVLPPLLTQSQSSRLVVTKRQQATTPLIAGTSPQNSEDNLSFTSSLSMRGLGDGCGHPISGNNRRQCYRRRLYKIYLILVYK